MRFSTAAATLTATAAAAASVAVNAKDSTVTATGAFQRGLEAFDLAPTNGKVAALRQKNALGSTTGRTAQRSGKPGRKVEQFARMGKVTQLKNQVLAASAEETYEPCDPTLDADTGVLGQCGAGRYCMESLPEYKLSSTDEDLQGVCAPLSTQELHRSLQSVPEGPGDETPPPGLPTDSIIGLMDFLCYDFDFPDGRFVCNCSDIDVPSYSGYMSCAYAGITYVEDNICGDSVTIVKDQVYTIDLEMQYAGTASQCYQFSSPQPFEYCYTIIYTGKYDVATCEQSFYGTTCNSCEFVKQGRDDCIAYDCTNTFLAREGVRCDNVLIDYIVDLYLDFYPLPCPDEVTLPPDECATISQIACTLPEFSTLCAAVQAADLGGPLSAGEWTVFAPTNDAFTALGELGVDLNAVLEDTPTLTNLLLFHTVNNATVATEDFICKAGENLLEMTNGRDIRTLCPMGGLGDPDRVKGFSNTEGVNLPNIILPDVEACNGVVHVIDQVLLDQTFRDIKPAAPAMRHLN